MPAWLLERLAFDPYAYVHRAEASFEYKNETEAIQEFARQFAERPDKCVGKIFVVSSEGTTPRKFWIAADLRVAELLPNQPYQIIADGFRTKSLHDGLATAPEDATAIASITDEDDNVFFYSALTLEDAKDRAALICLENLLRVDIFERKTFDPIGRVIPTDSGPVFIPTDPHAEPTPVRPRQVAEVLQFAGLEGQAIAF